MSVEQAEVTVGDVGLGVGKDFELSRLEFEPGVFQQAGEDDRELPRALGLLEREIEMESAAVAGGAGDGAHESQRFEGGGDAGQCLRVVVGVVEAACVDVEEAVAGFGGEANTIEVSTLLNQAITQGVSAFGFHSTAALGSGCSAQM